MTNSTPTNELGHSPDALAQRQTELLALLRQTAPDLVSDNQVNVDKLKELLGDERIAPPEHYELNWAGKAAARREIQKTSSHTLRPDANNPPHAQHMLIEGENLEVLRVLQKSYYGKVKMIYIDPPYNTGNDSFVYPDDYSETLDEYQKRTGEKSAEGFLNKQSLWKKNSKESGQYHSAWLSMMYPRLYLARNLLRDDGVIFISIDDNEAANLKLLCDEVFGAENFISTICHKARASVSNDKIISSNHNFILLYAKNYETIFTSREQFGLDPDLTGFDMTDDRGAYKYAPVDGPGGAAKGNPFYTFEGVTGYWRFAESRMKQMWDDGLVVKVGGGLQQKYYLEQARNSLKTDTTWWDQKFYTSTATARLKELFGFDVFSNPKHVDLIDRMLSLWVRNTGDLVMDFFGGSGSTAHAVMTANAIDGVGRQSISVQMPEILDETSEAYKADYRTIADITRARIDKVIAKLKAEHPDKTAGLACAHFTLAPSNFKVWRGDVGSVDALREQLALFQSAEKAGQPQATDAQSAMLTELLLKHGLGAFGVHAISSPKQVAEVTVHRVLLADDKHMWLCFEPFSEALKDEIVKAQPAQVVLLNSCFVGDKADEQLANLKLELAGLDIGLAVI
ncbi:MAG: site-specific DNA-methyltransferase [Proteobacteria bacterium]|nr:site-specific DNA-methyltransferase [Pseudomonadota bacterium]